MEDILKIIQEISKIAVDEGYLYLEIPTREKLDRLEVEGGKFQRIEPGTVVHLDGEEKGVVHHYFTRDELLSLLADKSFEIQKMHILQEHYCLTAKKNAGGEEEDNSSCLSSSSRIFFDNALPEHFLARAFSWTRL